MGLGRGHKTCPCGKVTGPRKKVCDSCGHEFQFKPRIGPKVQKGKAIHWKELHRGDIIKVLSGSGPYWKDKEGEKICIGYYGRFRVRAVLPEGIQAYPVGKTKMRVESGMCYIYMGKKKKSKIGSHLRPHKIRKLKGEQHV